MSIFKSLPFKKLFRYNLGWVELWGGMGPKSTEFSSKLEIGQSNNPFQSPNASQAVGESPSFHHKAYTSRSRG